MQILNNILWVFLIISSILLIGMVLLHRGRGGGIADMFGGGIASGIQSSAVGEKNLSKFTWFLAALWGMTVILLGVLAKIN